MYPKGKNSEALSKKKNPRHKAAQRIGPSGPETGPRRCSSSQRNIRGVTGARRTGVLYRLLRPARAIATRFLPSKGSGSPSVTWMLSDGSETQFQSSRGTLFVDGTVKQIVNDEIFVRRHPSQEPVHLAPSTKQAPPFQPCGIRPTSRQG